LHSALQLTDDTDIRDSWRRYCENLYRAELDTNDGSTPHIVSIIQSLYENQKSNARTASPPKMAGTLELTNSTEVEKAIKSLKDGKMAGKMFVKFQLSSCDSFRGKI